MKTGNTSQTGASGPCPWPPQWSPAMKTGNTCPADLSGLYTHEASMEPGHEDREYPPSRPPSSGPPQSLNGARP